MRAVDRQMYNKFFKNDIPEVAYFASFYLTICMHITPMEMAGKILDIFFMVGEDSIHYVIMGVLKSVREQLMSFPTEEKILVFLKNDLMRQVFTSGCIGSILIFDHLSEMMSSNTI